MCKLDSSKSLFFNGVANQLVSGHCQRVAASEDDEGIFTSLVDFFQRNDVLVNDCSFLGSPIRDIGQVNSYEALDDQIIYRQGTRFVEAANVDFACIRNSEWLRAKYLFLNHGNNSIIDRKRQFHGQLWRNDIGNNENTSQHYLVSASIWVLQPFRHHVVAGHQSKAEKNKQIIVNFHRFYRNSI